MAEVTADLTAGLSSVSSSGDEYGKRVRYGETTGPAALARAVGGSTIQTQAKSVQSRYGSGD